MDDVKPGSRGERIFSAGYAYNWFSIHDADSQRWVFRNEVIESRVPLFRRVRVPELAPFPLAPIDLVRQHEVKA